MDKNDADQIVRFIDNVAWLSVPLSSIERKIVENSCEKLKNFSDYSIPGVKPLLDRLVVLLCRFLATRMNFSPIGDAYRYLRAPEEGKELPKEWELQRDLFDFLASAGNVKLEQTHVASGRADIYIPYDDFRFVIEVKRTTERNWSCFRSRPHLRQSSAYGATDIRLGVLATLDLSVRQPGVPHISECLGVVRRRISRSDVRGVVFMRVPGNGSSPSSASTPKPKTRKSAAKKGAKVSTKNKAPVRKVGVKRKP